MHGCGSGTRSFVRPPTGRPHSPERHTVHGALAEATDQGVDPDRRAWHLAQATLRPDERVATELERSAARAQRRGGLAAAAAFLERAAALTPGRARRAARLVAAAGAKRDAGALDAAVGLLSAVEPETLDGLGRARLETLRGQIAFDHRRGREASRSLADAARTAGAVGRQPGAQDPPRGVECRDVGRRSGRARRDAERRSGCPAGAAAGWHAGRHRSSARWVRASPRGSDTGPRRAPLTRALEIVLAAEAPTDDRGHWLWLTVAGSAVTVPQELWDAEAWHTVASRREHFARNTGALVQLQFALHATAWSYVLGGQFDRAALLIEEDRTLAVATGNPPVSYADTLLAAFRGQDERASELIDHTAQEAAARGLTRVVNFADYGERGPPQRAGATRRRARRRAMTAFERDLAGFGPFVVPELVEAAARSGDGAQLSSALDWISERTRRDAERMVRWDRGAARARC